MSLHLGFDAAYPPVNPYPSCTVVCGYIGGNTPHIWTLEEWNRFQHLYQFPIWVGYNETDPVGHARECVSAMRRLHFSDSMPDERRRAAMLDYETEINSAWVDEFAGILWDAGYETMVYGSESTIVDNPAKEGRWVALYNGEMNVTGEYAIGHQYKANAPWNGTAVDLSVFTDAAIAHAGQGARS